MTISIEAKTEEEAQAIYEELNLGCEDDHKDIIENTWVEDTSKWEDEEC